MEADREKHLIYFNLREHLKDDHCPICSEAAAAGQRYFEAVLGEALNDPGVRQELIESKGYCPRHIQHLMSSGYALDRALLYRDQVELFLKLLNTADPVKIPSKSISEGWSSRGPCPACKAEQSAGQRYLDVLVIGLRERDFQDAYRSGPGLCVPHFLTMWRDFKEAAGRRILLETQRRKMDELSRELELFCNKHDYRLSPKGFGKEGDSWRRAIETMSGFISVHETLITKPSKTIKGPFRSGSVQRTHGMPRNRNQPK